MNMCRLLRLYLIPVAIVLAVPVLALTAGAAENGTRAVGKVTADRETASRPGHSGAYNLDTPRSAVEGFLYYASRGDFKDASRYLDLRYLPAKMKEISPEDLAHKLKIVLDRSMWLDLGGISDDPKGELNDGLPSYRESIGKIKTPKGTVDVLLQRVPGKGGARVWKFSNRTVAQIPMLYQFYGYRLFEEKLSRLFPNIHLLGWQLWQWCAWLVLVVLAYFLAWLPTLLLSRIIASRGTVLGSMVSQFVAGPAKIILWLVLGRFAAFFLKPSVEVKELLNAQTIFIFALCWASIRALDIAFELWKLRMERDSRQSSVVLLKPLRTVLRVVVVGIAILLWLDNIGVKVTALIAGLGVGGLAVALAAQDILKNLLGTVMILADRPYNVGERIVVRGYDGEVEEIGLRSTRLRLLTGHEVSIPNDEIERSEIENIGRRPHIRRRQNIRLALDTPPAKVERAVEIIRKVLENHEGMRPDYPPRVYFDTIRDDALNVVMFYWYHPPEYWDFLDFGQRVNSAILNAFEAEGIRLALPSSLSFVAGAEDAVPVHVIHDAKNERVR